MGEAKWRALYVWAAYLRASVRLWAVRLVRTTTWHPRYAAIVEQRHLEGWPRKTIETCARRGLGVGEVAGVGGVRA